jgi:translation initiation factor IF-2
MEKGLGVVADCVIRWGKVERGDFVVSGTTGGRVKFLNDVANNPLKRGRPSQPVRIVGFKSLPKAGDPIVCASSEDEAKEIIRLRESELINEERADFENDVELQVTGTAAKQGSMMQKAQQKYGFDSDDGEEDAGTIRIPVVIKADSHGALEAVRDALVSIGTESKLDIVIDPVEMSTGVVTTTDVRMARESDAAIFCFGKVGIADKETKTLAETEEVSIRNHLIIYRLLEDAKDIFAEYLPVEYETKVHGKANVQAVFEVTDKNKASVSVAGLRVTDGNLFKAKSSGEKPLLCFYRVLRNGDVVAGTEELKSISLRKVKEDVDSVKRGEECGLQLNGYNDLVEGDVIECYSIEEKRVAI